MKKTDIMYSLTTEDIQTVAEEDLGRKLSAQEIKLVSENVGNFLDWFQAISLAINEAKLK